MTAGREALASQALSSRSIYNITAQRTPVIILLARVWREVREGEESEPIRCPITQHYRTCYITSSLPVLCRTQQRPHDAAIPQSPARLPIAPFSQPFFKARV
jgi:hypothetical protein